MISFYVQKLFLIVFFITIRCETKNTCNDSCSTKTFYYKDEVNVTFTAQQINGINYLTINLAVYNITETKQNEVSVSIKSGPDFNKYSCERDPDGSTHSYYLDPKKFPSVVGTPLYQNNTLSCSWILSHQFWPTDLDLIKLDLEFYPAYEIILSRNKENLGVITSSKDLPIYHMNFLKCCNKVYGDDKIQLIVRQTNHSSDFTLLVINDTLADNSFRKSVVLYGPDDSRLRFNCHSDITNTNFSYLTMEDIPVSIESQLYYHNVASKRLCFWSMPILLRGFFGDYYTRNFTYGLKISYGNHTYTRNGVSLSSSGSTQFSNIFFVFFAFLFTQLML